MVGMRISFCGNLVDFIKKLKRFSCYNFIVKTLVNYNMSEQNIPESMAKELGSLPVCDVIGKLDFHKQRNQLGEAGVHNYGEICFTKQKSKLMDALWKEFCSMNDFPELYMRTVAKIALCKDPTTMREEHHDAIDLMVDNVDLIRAGDEVKVINTRFYKKTIFQRWDDRVFHKFRMRSGHYIFLGQDFIDSLTSQDKRYLCIGR
jgi:hypothetical protein